MRAPFFRVFDIEGNRSIYTSAHYVARYHFKDGVPYDGIAKIEVNGISYGPKEWYELYLAEAFDDEY